MKKSEANKEAKKIFEQWTKETDEIEKYYLALVEG